jgi:hypothetical protein
VLPAYGETTCDGLQAGAPPIADLLRWFREGVEPRAFSSRIARLFSEEREPVEVRDLRKGTRECWLLMRRRRERAHSVGFSVDLSVGLRRNELHHVRASFVKARFAVGQIQPRLAAASR